MSTENINRYPNYRSYKWIARPMFLGIPFLILLLFITHIKYMDTSNEILEIIHSILFLATFPALILWILFPVTLPLAIIAFFRFKNFQKQPYEKQRQHFAKQEKKMSEHRKKDFLQALAYVSGADKRTESNESEFATEIAQEMLGKDTSHAEMHEYMRNRYHSLGSLDDHIKKFKKQGFSAMDIFDPNYNTKVFLCCLAMAWDPETNSFGKKEIKRVKEVGNILGLSEEEMDAMQEEIMQNNGKLPADNRVNPLQDRLPAELAEG